MRAKDAIMRAAGLGFGLILWGFLAGCASSPKVDWNSRIGTYTYDQAVVDLGPPDKTAQLSDGTTVADWITHRHGGLSFGVGTGFFSGGGTAVGTGVGTSTGFPDHLLRLTFGPDGKLVNYQKR